MEMALKSLSGVSFDDASSALLSSKMYSKKLKKEVKMQRFAS
jgi:hypothetical protein